LTGAGRDYLARNRETRFRKPTMRTAPRPTLSRTDEIISEIIRIVVTPVLPDRASGQPSASGRKERPQDELETTPCQVNKYEKAGSLPNRFRKVCRLQS
jgi:hypothetical protein